MMQKTHTVKSERELIYNPLEFLRAFAHRDEHCTFWKHKDNTLVTCSCQKSNLVQAPIYK
jgi:hypothetical protein